MHRRSRLGLTLVELMIALSLAGVVMLAGAAMLDQVNDGGARIARARRIDAREGNGLRLMDRIFAEADRSADSSQVFRGDERTLELRTRCPSPRGWTKRCRLQLAIDSLRDSSIIVAIPDGSPPLAVRRLSGRAEFRYVNLAGADSIWVRRWTTAATFPTAFAILDARDTLIYPIAGARD